MITFCEADLTDSNPLRLDYFNSLTKFQDIYLELMIQESIFYRIVKKNQSIGYLILTKDKILIEFYLVEEFVEIGSGVLKTIVKKFGIKHILCKSFDGLLLSICILLKYAFKPTGYLFRDDLNKIIPEDKDLTVRYAELNDLEFLFKQEDEVFEPKNLLHSAIANKNILFYHKNDELIGCGFLTQIHNNSEYYDIGVWIRPSQRKKGYGTQIIRHLKKTCLTKGKVPVAGCSIKNIASKRMLEKTGMISKYLLLEFTTKK